jgi:metal-responsive CopG/Arc/MetJ family transcriptional regulator
MKKQVLHVTLPMAQIDAIDAFRATLPYAPSRSAIVAKAIATYIDSLEENPDRDVIHVPTPTKVARRNVNVDRALYDRIDGERAKLTYHVTRNGFARTAIADFLLSLKKRAAAEKPRLSPLTELHP